WLFGHFPSHPKIPTGWYCCQGDQQTADRPRFSCWDRVETKPLLHVVDSREVGDRDFPNGTTTRQVGSRSSLSRSMCSEEARVLVAASATPRSSGSKPWRARSAWDWRCSL